MAPDAPSLLTTGQLAKSFGVSRGTVINWIDCGLLRHYRMPNGSRRVPQTVALEFARSRNYATTHLESLSRSSLAPLDLLAVLTDTQTIPLPLTQHGVHVTIVSDSYSAVAALTRREYDAAVVDIALGRDASRMLCEWITRRATALPVAVLVNEDDDPAAWEGCSAAAWQKPVDLVAKVGAWLSVGENGACGA